MSVPTCTSNCDALTPAVWQTARELCALLVRSSGCLDYKDFLRSWCGAGGPGYSVSIGGGYCGNARVPPDRIVVSTAAGWSGCLLFPARPVWDEVKGGTVAPVQPPLF